MSFEVDLQTRILPDSVEPGRHPLEISLVLGSSRGVDLSERGNFTPELLVPRVIATSVMHFRQVPELKHLISVNGSLRSLEQKPGVVPSPGLLSTR